MFVVVVVVVVVVCVIQYCEVLHISCSYQLFIKKAQRSLELVINAR